MEKERVRKHIVILGGGMAGLTAAMYAGRMNLETIVLENGLLGGQIINATGIENYPGFQSVSGKELIETLQAQAEGYGVVIDEFDEVERLDLKTQPKIVETGSYLYEADVVILATGMNRRKLPLPEEAKYSGRGVHYCELCDGHMYQGKTIAVMGGGNAAVDAAIFLMKYAKKLYLIQRSELRADEVSQKKLVAEEKVEVLTQTEIQKVLGEGAMEALEIFDKRTKETKILPVDGLFVNIGVDPNTELFKDVVDLDEMGRVKAGEDCRTNIPGVFAAGDIRGKEVRQLTTAASDGTTAAILAEAYIEKQKG